MIALAKYNSDPWDLDQAKATLTEIYELWKEKKGAKMGKASQGSLAAAFKHCKQLHNMKYRDIKSFHVQDCIDNCGKGASTQANIKNLFGHLGHLADELGMLTRPRANMLTTDSKPETSKGPFTEEELASIWKISEVPWVDSILVLMYTGMRLGELQNLKAEDVNLEAGTLKAASGDKAGKTRAADNRIIPIHSRIMPFVQNRTQAGDEYLFAHAGSECSDYRYYRYWGTALKPLGLDHKRAHECRHTFRSRLDSAGANKRCIDLIMGHASTDVGLRVYTHKTVDELKQTIELLA